MTATMEDQARIADGAGQFADVPELEPRVLWIPPRPRGWLRRTVDEAIEFGWEQVKDPTQDWTGLCQSFCRQAYAVPAWNGSAIGAWKKIPARHKTVGGDPSAAPRGALLYYSGGKYGHVAIAIGKRTDWKCLSNDYQAKGRIGQAPRTFPRWGIRYLGWSAWTPFGSMNV